MGVLKHFEMHKPFLECVKDGKVYTLKDVCIYIIKYFNRWGKTYKTYD